MRKVKSIIGAIALSVAVTSSYGQTNVESFFTSAYGYLTSFNTNYTWTGVTLEAATGVKQVNGLSTANTINVQYDLGNFNIGAAGQLYGVGSAFNVVEAQVGYRLISHYDTALDVDLRAGYDSVSGGAVVEPLVQIKKKLTLNTYLAIGASLPIETVGKIVTQPSYYAEAGFTF